MAELWTVIYEPFPFPIERYWKGPIFDFEWAKIEDRAAYSPVAVAHFPEGEAVYEKWHPDDPDPRWLVAAGGRHYRAKDVLSNSAVLHGYVVWRRERPFRIEL